MKRTVLGLVLGATAAGVTASLAPAVGQTDGRGLSDLRSHHPLRIPRLGVDLSDPRKKAPSTSCAPNWATI